MVVGGVASIWKVRGGLMRASQEVRGRKTGTDPSSMDPLDLDISSPWIIGLCVTAALLVGGVYYSLTGHLGITLVTSVIMLVMSFFFSAVASYIVQ